MKGTREAGSFLTEPVQPTRPKHRAADRRRSAVECRMLIFTSEESHLGPAAGKCQSC